MGTHGKAANDTRKALAAHEPFKRHGFAMSAVAGAVNDTGQLSFEHREQYRADADAGRITYTVLSYRTPIAWVLDTGEVVRPDARYSPTTSQHQGMLYLLTSPNAAY